MRVVIVGDIQRSAPGDVKLVNDLIDGLKDMYPQFLFIVTTATERGIGKFVLDRIHPSNIDGVRQRPEIRYLDIRYKLFGDGLSRAEQGNLYLTRNAALLSAGEEFHLFMGREKRGYIQNLLELVEDAQLPHSVYSQTEQTGPKLLR